MSKPETLMIDDVKYVREDSIKQNTLAGETDGMKYCVVRCTSAGVHIGYVKERKGGEVTLINSRRLFSWSGACSLSQVAADGVDAENSRIAVTLPEIELLGVIEVIPTTEKAKECIEGAKEWKL